MKNSDMDTDLNFDYDVRIPRALIQQMMDGDITPSMLLTMNVLYKWADWSTGRVRWCSSGGLRTATHKAYSDRTFRVSLERLEEMGWITRHMVPGSHKDYPLTIHNYKWVCDETCKEHKKDGAGKVHILNRKKIKVCDPFKVGACRETSHEGSQETSQETSHEGSQETSQKVLYNTKPDTQRDTHFDLLSENEGKLVGKLVGSDELRSSSRDAAEAAGTFNPSNQKQTRTKQEENQTPEPEELAREEVLTFHAVADNQEISMLLGVPSFNETHVQPLERIARVLVKRNRSAVWLRDMIRWMKQHKGFWAKRLYAGDHAVTQLAKHMESGSCCEQFDAHVTVGGKEPQTMPDLAADLAKENARAMAAIPTSSVTLGGGFDIEEI